MATDIAFAVGILALVGNRVPGRLKLFLLTLAIVDDLGAIAVIAIFYTSNLNTTALVAAVGLIGVIIALRALGVWWMPVYMLVGAGLWLAVFESGVHATLAGVACGLLAPAKPRRPQPTEVAATAENSLDELNAILFDAKETRSVVDRLIHGLHPVVALLIVPVFALANTGVSMTPAAIADAMAAPASQAIMFGLVVGKPLGITVAAWLAVKAGLAVLPEGTNWRHIIGVGFLGGIGFTVSLFITDLAFDSATTVDNAKIGVLFASVAASLIGAGLLLTSPVSAPAGSDHEAGEAVGPITFAEFDSTRPQSIIASGAAWAPSAEGAGRAVADDAAAADSDVPELTVPQQAGDGHVV